MNEYDQMVARQVERDGVRMASGQHIPATDTPRTVPSTWEECECGAAWDPQIVTFHRCRLGDPWIDRRDDDR